MTDLSPAAQAVMDAAHAQDAEPYPVIVAAVLRAAAKQLAPTPEDHAAVPDLLAQTCMNGMAYVVNELRGIAEELDPLPSEPPEYPPQGSNQWGA